MKTREGRVRGRPDERSGFGSRLRSTASRTTVLATRRGDVAEWLLRVARVVRRARGLARRAAAWLAATVTPTGAIVLATATVGLAVGVGAGWAELTLAGLVAAVLLVTAIPFLFGAASYSIDLRLTDERVMAGTRVGGRIRVRNVGRVVTLPGRVDVPVGAGLIDVAVPTLVPGAEHVEPLDVFAARRGVITVGPATAVRTDPIGLVTRVHTSSEVSLLYVHPRIVPVPTTTAGFIRDLEGSASTVLVDSDISFHAIREYAPGDPQRHIHWKSTARFGRLMVRQYEETRRSRIALVLSRNREDYASEDEFELAVSAVGSLGTRAIRDGRDLEVVVGADVPEVVRSTVTTTERLRAVSPRVLLDGLAGVELAARSTALEGVCAQAGEEVAGLSLGVVALGSLVSTRRLQAVSLGFPIPVATLAIRCEVDAAPSIRTSGSLTIMTIGRLDDLRKLLARSAAS